MISTFTFFLSLLRSNSPIHSFTHISILCIHFYTHAHTLCLCLYIYFCMLHPLHNSLDSLSLILFPSRKIESLRCRDKQINKQTNKHTKCLLELTPYSCWKRQQKNPQLILGKTDKFFNVLWLLCKSIKGIFFFPLHSHSFPLSHIAICSFIASLFFKYTQFEIPIWQMLFLHH